jgi:hypothetical protein
MVALWTIKTIIMKKLLMILMLLPLLGSAQLKTLLGGNNVIKTNLFGLAIKNYNVTYERAILKKFSLSVGYRTMAKTKMPSSMAKQLENTLNNDFISFEGLEMGNRAITAEFRFYPGLRKLRGFYVAPYYRNASFDLTIPVKNPADANRPMLFNGTIKSNSYGLMIGKQTVIAKFLVLDFWILGGHYGTSKGSLVANNISTVAAPADFNLNDYVGTQVTQEAGPFKVTGTATGTNSARVDMDGPWLGIRSIALSLGFKF